MWTQLMNQITASGGTALTFDDSAIKGWTLPPGHRLERFSLDGGKAVFARLSSTTALNNDFPSWAERGLSFQFQVEMNNISSGKRIEVGVIARSAQSNGSHNLNVVYATQQAGNSGWQKLELSPQFQLLKFTYDVPAVPTGYQSAPIVVLHSDEAGSGRGVELLGIYVKPL